MQGLIPEAAFGAVLGFTAMLLVYGIYSGSLYSIGLATLVLLSNLFFLFDSMDVIENIPALSASMMLTAVLFAVVFEPIPGDEDRDDGQESDARDGEREYEEVSTPQL